MGSGGGAFGGGLDGENRGLKSIFVDLKQAQRSVSIVTCEGATRRPHAGRYREVGFVQTSKPLCLDLGLPAPREMGNGCPSVSIHPHLERHCSNRRDQGMAGVPRWCSTQPRWVRVVVRNQAHGSWEEGCLERGLVVRAPRAHPRPWSASVSEPGQ